MENIKTLPVDEEHLERLKKFSEQYQRNASIFFKVLAVDDDKKEITVRIVQKKNMLNRYLNQRELVERGKELFDGELPPGYKVHFRAIEYSPNEIDIVDHEWLKSQMESHGLQNKDLVAALGVDRFVISKMVNGEKLMNSFQRSAFFYYFKCVAFQGKSKAKK